MENFNLKNLNLVRAKIEELENENVLPSGGYICKITNVMDYEDCCVILEIEVDEGEYKGYFANGAYSHELFDNMIKILYEPEEIAQFARLITALEESNPGYQFDGVDEQAFVGKRIGVVFIRQEISIDDDSVEMGIVATNVISIKNIRSGQFSQCPPLPLNYITEQEMENIKKDIMLTQANQCFALLKDDVEYDENNKQNIS